MNEAERRAERAENLLKDPMFADAFNGVRQDLFEAIATSGIADKNLRHEAYLSLRVLSSVRGRLESYIRQGREEVLKRDVPPQVLRVQEL